MYIKYVLTTFAGGPWCWPETVYIWLFILVARWWQGAWHRRSGRHHLIPLYIYIWLVIYISWLLSLLLNFWLDTALWHGRWFHALSCLDIPSVLQHDGDFNKQTCFNMQLISKFPIEFVPDGANPNCNYADQSKVFSDVGMGILDNAMEGFNCSLFAYGQTGSGAFVQFVV